MTIKAVAHHLQVSWDTIKDIQATSLQAASALAKYDPESQKWAKVLEAVGNDLVNVPAVYLATWMESLRPVRVKLLAPLSVVFVDVKRREVERSLATDILADQPQVLADLLMNADEKQFAVIYPRFKERGEQGLPILMTEIAKTLPKELPLSGDKRETLAKRQANAAVALLRMNWPAKVWPLLRHSPDPRVRSYLIHRLSPLGADARAVVKHLDEETDFTIRRALLLSLGEFTETDITPEDRKVLLPKLQAIYRNDADSGFHAASEWLLREWEKKGWQEKDWLTQVNEEWAKDEEGRDKRIAEIKKQLASRVASAPGVPPSPPQWYVNTQGQTYVVIPGPVEFTMGSPKTEKDHYTNEVQHQRRIGRSYALASKSVTLAEYRNLTKDKYEIDEKYTHSPDLPVVGISWYMAAKYCNLLSKEEGLEECYEIKGPENVVLKAKYLNLSGYRLPTEAEMEYATRSGAATSRYYGETDELLGQYAWYTKSSGDSLQRVGLKKPNDFGLFDVQGNCFTWCQEPYDAYPEAGGDKAVEDKEGKLVVISTNSRVLRGGSFAGLPSLVRSANRNDFVPAYRNYSVGFRPSRTFIP